MRLVGWVRGEEERGGAAAAARRRRAASGGDGDANRTPSTLL